MLLMLNLIEKDVIVMIVLYISNKTVSDSKLFYSKTV